MSGFNISNRQIALFLMAVAVLWALAEGVPVWLIAVHRPSAPSLRSLRLVD